MYKRTPLDAWTAKKLGIRCEEPSCEAVLAYQLDRLRTTVGYARSRSPFYAEHLAAFPETQIASLEDIERLPFTTAVDLTGQGLRFLCVSQSEINRVVTLESSGTSGAPKRVFFTAEDQELTLDFFQAGMSGLVDPGQSVIITLPHKTPDSVGDLLARALRGSGVKPITVGPITDAAAVQEAILREKADCIVGLPVQILSLIRGRRRISKCDAPSRVLLCSDHVCDSIVNAIRQAWQCEVFEHYGMTEMGLGGGVDCPAHAGYHLREADLYFEVVDMESGEPVPDGQYGELVFTTLTRRGMPFIRYRTGDVARFLKGPCACGSVLRRLERVRTRVSDGIEIEGRQITMAAMDEELFALPEVQDFRAMLVSSHPRRLIVTALVAEGGGELTEMKVRELLGRVPGIRLAQKTGHIELVVKVNDLEFLPHSGKRKIVVEQVA